MEIIKIGKTKLRTNPIKVYATVKGDSGQEYSVSYTRRGKKGAGFRGWSCSCPNFVLSKIGKNGHCKHIDFIQDTYGRYGSRVGLPQVGDTVFISEKVNSVWTGQGIITRGVLEDHPLKDAYVIVKMTTGKLANREGGFKVREVEVQPTA